MPKAPLAAALALGLIIVAMPQFVSSAAAQQQATASEKKAMTKKEPSAGQAAARERQKKCSAEWKEAKASNKVDKGVTWPKFWSDCNKRLKEAAK